MQVLIPISGQSQFFPQEEYYFPKPLVEVAGRPMIERVVRQIKSSLTDAKYTFVISQDHARQFSLDSTLNLLGGAGTSIIQKHAETNGALCSCLLAIDEVDPEQPLVIMNSDQMIDDNLDAHIKAFKDMDVDAGVITFPSVHPRWSYVIPDDNKLVAQVVEKRVASDVAIAGFYYFRKARDFFEAAKQAILNDDQVNGVYFISATMNQIILTGGKVGYTRISARKYHNFFSPKKIEEFGETAFAKTLRERPGSGAQINVIIPAAGEGSRFAKAGWKSPKPFIDVNGKMMVEHVIDNVAPEPYKKTLLLRKAHIEASPEKAARLSAAGADILSVDELTEGTACTVLLGRQVFDNDDPMMVANSDQLVDFDVKAYVDDCLNRELDGSILVFRDKFMDPKWSFAKVDESGLVTEVAEKKVISDLATVGIYFFTRGSDFVKAAVDMIARNDRVNNEFYTCPVYNYMIKNGAKIGVYEVEFEDMKGLGIPDDLNGYLAEINAPASTDAPD